MEPGGRQRDVGCELALEVLVPSVVLLQVAPAGVPEREQLTVDAEELALAPDGGRGHVVRLEPGPVHVGYSATLRAALPTPGGTPTRVDEDAVVGLRPSRYCPSDSFAGFAALTLPAADSPAEVARAAASWVFEHLVLGATGGRSTDSAVDALLAGAGVCRDFAHVLISLCRARGVPARFAAVYAPGLSPMDFHAVVEVRTEHGWEVLDPTRRAPRSTLVRISTGRDAADTAFLTTIEGAVELRSVEVTAYSDGDLPLDDHLTPTWLA